VHIAGAPVARRLGELAERHRSARPRRRGVIDELGGDDRVRTLAFLYPLPERGQGVERIWTRAAAAVMHAGNEEQADVLLHLAQAAFAFVDEILVERHGANRR